MTSFRTALVAGDGRLHVTTSPWKGGLTLCNSVVGALASRPAVVTPLATCEACHRAAGRLPQPAPGRAA